MSRYDEVTSANSRSQLLELLSSLSHIKVSRLIKLSLLSSDIIWQLEIEYEFFKAAKAWRGYTILEFKFVIPGYMTSCLGIHM